MGEIDRAKAIARIRDELAELAVQQRVVSELQALVEDKLSDLYRGESRVRGFFAALGFQMPDGPFDADAIVKALEAGVKDGSGKEEVPGAAR